MDKTFTDPILDRLTGCQYAFAKGPNRGEKCGRPVIEGNQFCKGCRSKKTSNIKEVEENDFLHVIQLETPGYFREPKWNILIQQLPNGDIIAKGICNKNILEKPYILNEEEKTFCKKKKGLIIDTSVIDQLKKNNKARIIWKAWKRYWYISKDENGDCPYIKSLKSKNGSVIL